MARTRRSFPLGEFPGHETPDPTGGGADSWAEETTIVSGSWSRASYKADHTGAAGKIYKLGAAFGNGTVGGSPTTVDRQWSECGFYLTDITPADFIYLTYGMGYLGDNDGSVAILSLKTDGNIDVIAADGFTVIATFTPVWSANTWVKIGFLQEKTAANTRRFRLWMASYGSSSWGTALVDDTDSSMTVNTGNTALTTWASSNIGGSVAPGITMYLDDVIAGLTIDSDTDLPASPGMVGWIGAPTADGAEDTWTAGTGGATAYTEVDETPYSDADYAQPDTGGNDSQTFVFPDLAGLMSNAKEYIAYNLMVRGGITAGHACTINTRIIEGASIASGSNLSHAAFDHMFHSIITSPAGSTFTETIINSLEGGARRQDLGVNVDAFMSSVFVTVWFLRHASIVRPSRASMRAGLVR